MEQELTTASESQPENQMKVMNKILQEAHDAVSRFDMDSAKSLFENAATKFPENEKALFELGYFLYEQNEPEMSAFYLTKAIERAPFKNSKKYFTLAQLKSNDFQIASGLYFKGIEIASQKLQVLQGSLQIEKISGVKRLLSQGFCGLAHLNAIQGNLQNDLSNCQKFLDFIQKAIQADSFNLEPYSQLALFYFNKGEEDFCRKTLTELSKKIEEIEECFPEELTEYGLEFYLTLTRVLVELQMWDQALVIIETGLFCDNSDLEANYLYAFCLFKIEEFDQAKEICSELEKLKLLESGDEELIEGFVELRDEINQALVKQNKAKNADVKAVPDSDDDWIEDD